MTSPEAQNVHPPVTIHSNVDKHGKDTVDGSVAKNDHAKSPSTGSHGKFYGAFDQTA
jgi:hypothetical protein